MRKEKRKEYYKEYNKQYYQVNKKKLLEYQKQYQEENKDKIAEYKKQYNKQYNKTPIGRASKLLRTYNQSDKKYNRGKGDLTAQWIVENIFSKPCAHCGKEGWEIIGCNRINNDLPHTKDNVEPCCLNCNCRLPKKMGLTSPS